MSRAPSVPVPTEAPWSIPTPRLRHGPASPGPHPGRDAFAGLDGPAAAARYDAPVVDGASLPAALELAARTADGEVMVPHHRRLGARGVQSPPEPILTHPGLRLIENLITPCRKHKEAAR